MALPKGLLSQYLTPAGVFIETGTHMGDGVQEALDAGFTCIHTVDISPFCFGYCTARFEGLRDKVNLFNGDSRQFMRRTLAHLTTQATFWLDAHFCGGDGGNKSDVPLMKELSLLSRHPIRNHVILIDDVRLMGTEDLTPNLVAVSLMLRNINPGYQIRFVDSRDFCNDILVAIL